MEGNKENKAFNSEVIGLGVDILEVDRIKDTIKRFGDKFLQRIYTPKEINYCQSKKRSAESFAARFSAKEAFVKAVEANEVIPYSDIEVAKKESKKPQIVLHGKAKKAAEKKNITEILVSLSHEKNYVIAHIILKGRKI